MDGCVSRLGRRGLTLAMTLWAIGCRPAESAYLAWGDDPACVGVYRVDIEGAPSRRFEFFPDRSDPSGPGRVRWRTHMRSSDGRDVTRTAWSTPVAFGPASPDAPCRRAPIDPLEHALAVAWPTLPDRRVAAGEGWVGRKAGGLCNGLAVTSGELTAGSWTHRLVAVRRDGTDTIAEIETTFAGAGTATALIDVDAGRLLDARARLEPPARAGTPDAERPAPWVTTVEFEGCAAPSSPR